MFTTITPGAMQALEQQYMQAHGVPGALLMEHAAQAVCVALQRHIPGGHALFLCGPGNNGGDGYAAARLWQVMGGTAAVMELSAAAHGDAGMNRRLALEAGVSIRSAALPLPPCDMLVDALFGTGLSRPAEGLAAELIRAMNQGDTPVLAVDIPSGLDGETGRALGETVHAVETVTFHRVKQGLLLRQGPACAGKITLAPILIPENYGDAPGLRWMDRQDVSRLIPPRPADCHKGSFGRVVIFAGSEGMAGAAAFAAGAAVKAGAGLTTVLCRQAVLPIVQALAPGATCQPLNRADVPRLLARADAAVAGCGLGLETDALPVLAHFRQAACPVVWDADALNLLARTGETLPANAVITPHPGEAARLLGWTVQRVAEEPLGALSALHRRYGCHVLLKGAHSLMTDGTRTAVNVTGSPALAKGGSGDVLSGMLGALLARHLPCTQLEAMQLAALLHGEAGIRAAGQWGENCVTPMELIRSIRLD